MLRIRGRTLRDESLETNTARDLEQVVRMFVEMDVGPVSPSSTTQDTSHRVQKWNVGPEYRKRLEQPCGYFGKRTPFLRWRVQLLRIREKSFTVRRIWVWALLLVYPFIPVRQYFTLYQQYLLILKKVNKPLCLTHCSYLLG